MININDAGITTNGYAVCAGTIIIENTDTKALQITDHDQLCVSIGENHIDIIPYMNDRIPRNGFLPHPVRSFAVGLKGAAQSFFESGATMRGNNSKIYGQDKMEVSSTELEAGFIISSLDPDSEKQNIQFTIRFPEFRCRHLELGYEFELTATIVNYESRNFIDQKDELGKITIRLLLNKATCYLLYGNYLKEIDSDSDIPRWIKVSGANLNCVPGQLNIENAFIDSFGGFFVLTRHGSGVLGIKKQIFDRREKGHFLACNFSKSSNSNGAGMSLHPITALERDEQTGFYKMKSYETGNHIKIVGLTRELLNYHLNRDKKFIIEARKGSSLHHTLGFHEGVTGYAAADIGTSLIRDIETLKVDGELKKSGLILNIRAELSAVKGHANNNYAGDVGPTTYSKVITINWETLIIRHFNVYKYIPDILEYLASEKEPATSKVVSIYSKIVH